MKKGQSIQFNWIFVIVAGAIILTFFVGFGVQYSSLMKSKENAEISRSIDQIINGLRGQEQYKEINLNTNFELGFRCDGYIINNDPKSYMNLSGKTLFIQQKTNTNSYYVWVKEFKRGYKIDNVIYLIDQKKDFYLVNNGNEAYVNELMLEIPIMLSNVKVISLEELEQLDIKDKNNEFVFFNHPDQSAIDKYKLKGDLIIVNTDNKEITFDQDNYKFVDSTTLFGAIFSGSSKSYDCGFKSLTNKFNNINNIYISKARSLNDCCSNGICNYNNIIEKLVSLNVDSNDAEFNEIDQLNRNLGNYCKVIY